MTHIDDDEDDGVFDDFSDVLDNTVDRQNEAWNDEVASFRPDHDPFKCDTCLNAAYDSSHGHPLHGGVPLDKSFIDEDTPPRLLTQLEIANRIHADGIQHARRIAEEVVETLGSQSLPASPRLPAAHLPAIDVSTSIPPLPKSSEFAFRLRTSVRLLALVVFVIALFSTTPLAATLLGITVCVLLAIAEVMKQAEKHRLEDAFNQTAAHLADDAERAEQRCSQAMKPLRLLYRSYQKERSSQEKERDTLLLECRNIDEITSSLVERGLEIGTRDGRRAGSVLDRSLEGVRVAECPLGPADHSRLQLAKIRFASDVKPEQAQRLESMLSDRGWRQLLAWRNTVALHRLGGSEFSQWRDGSSQALRQYAICLRARVSDWCERSRSMASRVAKDQATVERLHNKYEVAAIAAHGKRRVLDVFKDQSVFLPELDDWTRYATRLIGRRRLETIVRAAGHLRRW